MDKLSMNDSSRRFKTHLQLIRADVVPDVIVCGSPERAEFIATLLEGTKQLMRNREYHSYRGGFGKKELLVVSHGVGAPGAAICFQELIDLGVKTIIRVGTAGGLYEDCRIGDIVVPFAAVRRDGVSNQMIPAVYPASADPFLFYRICKACEKKQISVRSGIVVTSDLFYPALLDNEFELYKRANAIAVEMECATLFVMGQLQKISTASLLVLDGNPLKWKEGYYDPKSDSLQRSLESAIKIALEVLGQ